MSEPLTASVRRAFTRIRTAMPAELHPAQGQTLHGTTCDLSLNGALLTGPGPWPEAGAEAVLAIHLDPDTAIRAHARVVRHVAMSDGSTACAVGFADLLGADSYHHLRTLLLWNAPTASPVADEIGRHIGLKSPGA